MYFQWFFTFRFACKSGSAIEKYSRSHLARGSTSVLPWPYCSETGLIKTDIDILCFCLNDILQSRYRLWWLTNARFDKFTIKYRKYQQPERKTKIKYIKKLLQTVLLIPCTHDRRSSAFSPAGGAARRVWEATQSSRLAKFAWKHAHKQKQVHGETPITHTFNILFSPSHFLSLTAEFFKFTAATSRANLRTRHFVILVRRNLNYVTCVITPRSMKCYLNGSKTAGSLWCEEHSHWLTWKPWSPPRHYHWPFTSPFTGELLFNLLIAFHFDW